MKITLKAARVNAGFSQAEVAKKLNKQQCTIHAWEKGTTSIKAKDFENLCTLYKIEAKNVLLPHKGELRERKYEHRGNYHKNR